MSPCRTNSFATWAGSEYFLPRPVRLQPCVCPRSFPISLRVQATLCNGFVRVYAKQYDDYELEVLELLRKVRTWSVREQREAKHEGAARVAKNDNITRRFICAEDDDSLAFEIDGDAVGWEHRAREPIAPMPRRPEA
jgi:hypothetical protein